MIVDQTFKRVGQEGKRVKHKVISSQGQGKKGSFDIRECVNRWLERGCAENKIKDTRGGWITEVEAD